MADPNEPELPPIVESRKSARKRVILSGKIVYNDGAYSTDCCIRDLSEGGARVVVTIGIAVPHNVVLIDMKTGTAYESEVVWAKASEFGLKFLAKHSMKGTLPAQLQYPRRFHTAY